MRDRLRFFLNRLSERLWVRPLVVCGLSIAGAFLAKAADRFDIQDLAPEITPDSVETLLAILSSSMLVIATFAVASMVTAYASASTTATPRSFPLVVSDDVSQNALSTFIGAFIFSIVALIALKNSYYDVAGRFALFALTLLVFAAVILTFVRWVDRIARLGRLGATVDKVEAATASALKRRRQAPTLRAAEAAADAEGGRPVFAHAIGYVQRVDVASLQAHAQKAAARIRVAALPGTFAAPGRPLAFVVEDGAGECELDEAAIARAFVIGGDRLYDDDPRFGLVVLSEIASRALSPAINDPGTAIDIIGTLVRLFALWGAPGGEGEREVQPVECDRVEAPALSVADMMDDAFTPIARDGAATVEVGVRLQKALASLAAVGDPALREAAFAHSRLALARAERAVTLPEDLEVLRRAAGEVT